MQLSNSSVPSDPNLAALLFPGALGATGTQPLTVAPAAGVGFEQLLAAPIPGAAVAQGAEAAPVAPAWGARPSVHEEASESDVAAETPATAPMCAPELLLGLIVQPPPPAAEPIATEVCGSLASTTAEASDPAGGNEAAAAQAGGAGATATPVMSVLHATRSAHAANAAPLPSYGRSAGDRIHYARTTPPTQTRTTDTPERALEGAASNHSLPGPAVIRTDPAPTDRSRAPGMPADVPASASQPGVTPGARLAVTAGERIERGNNSIGPAADAAVTPGAARQSREAGESDAGTPAARGSRTGGASEASGLAANPQALRTAADATRIYAAGHESFRPSFPGVATLTALSVEMPAQPLTADGLAVRPLPGAFATTAEQAAPASSGAAASAATPTTKAVTAASEQLAAASAGRAGPRTVALRDRPGAPAAGEANFAARARNLFTAGEPSPDAVDKSSVTAREQEVTPFSRKLGIDGANSPVLMSARTFAQPPTHPASEYTEAGAALFAGAADEARAGAEAAAMPQAAGNAQRAVEVVLHAVEQVAGREQKAVNLQFSVGDAELSVRVELQADGVQTTFRTDSPELRAALSHEWQAATSHGDRPVRLAPPVITDSSAANAFTGDASAGQRDGARRGHAGADTPAVRGLGARPAGSTSGAEAAPARLAPAPSATSHHLHTLA